jgi:hypothetical protein
MPFDHGTGSARDAFVPPPWDPGRHAIHAFLRSQSAHGSPRPPDLPDEGLQPAARSLRWAPGALDGALGHHFGTESDGAREIFDALFAACASPTTQTLRRLYETMLHGSGAIGAADSLISLLVATPPSDIEALYRIAVWLAEESPDREPVKFGIVLLGCIRADEPPTELLATLGSHDEFTLYVAEAFAKLPGRAKQEGALWQLAKRVSGWGRIQVVERLAGTSDPAIRDWMLRDGFRNSVMYEYLAYTCAESGGLLDALRAERVDDHLICSAGEIINALIVGGPAQDVGDYVDSAEVITLFVELVERRRLLRLVVLRSLKKIGRFAAASSRSWDGMACKAWSASLRSDIVSAVDRVKEWPEWPRLVREALSSPDHDVFYDADIVAAFVGVDAWEKRFERQAGSKDRYHWSDLMRTQDVDRVRRVVDLATRQLDLKAIAIGPEGSLGFGKSFDDHTSLGFIVKHLASYQGVGWELVSAALRTPGARLRTDAVETLHAWGRDSWTAEMTEVLLFARQQEPDPALRGRMDELLSAASGQNVWKDY